MRTILFSIVLICACSLAIQAQDEVSTFEVFGGYSYLRTGNPYDQDSHGWNTSVAANLTKYLAVKADFGGYYDNFSRAAVGGPISVNTSIHTYLFGPQFNFRATERVNPFVHALFGGAYDRASARRGAARTVVTDVGFAMALGGGLDAKMSDRVSFRVFQTDYLLTRYRDPFITPSAKRTIHHFRFSTGLVFH